MNKIVGKLVTVMDGPEMGAFGFVAEVEDVGAGPQALLVRADQRGILRVAATTLVVDSHQGLSDEQYETARLNGWVFPLERHEANGVEVVLYENHLSQVVVRIRDLDANQTVGVTTFPDLAGAFEYYLQASKE